MSYGSLKRQRFRGRLRQLRQTGHRRRSEPRLTVNGQKDFFNAKILRCSFGSSGRLVSMGNMNGKFVIGRGDGRDVEKEKRCYERAAC